jgi:AMMECR1 domain-containing protein
LIDGVILRHGGKGATFLPQVWSQLPDAETFLEHLCLKAGLPASAWDRKHPDIYTYQVQCFREERR